jgi:Bax protein
MLRRTMLTRTTLFAMSSFFLAACSDGHDYQAEILSSFPDLSCQGLAKASGSTWQSPTPGRRSIASSQLLALEDSEAVLRHFEAIGYDYDAVREVQQPVPRVYLAKMPSNLSAIDEVNTRKRLFLATMLPAVLQVNEEIREVRRRLIAIDACEHSGLAVAQPVQDWVALVAERHRSKPQAAALLRKIGEISPSLALAQAAVESGWGTSNPAQSINSLFGQYAFPDDDGATGKGAKDGPPPVPRLATYGNILEAVRGYADNLNTHRAYGPFRARRLAMIEKGEPLNGLRLAEKLGPYSIRRAAYIHDVQRMIRGNGLAALDKADFGHHPIEVAVNSAR